MARDGIDRRAVARYAKNLQKEFAKHPIRIPVETENRGGWTSPTFGGSTTVHHGPVFHGDVNGAQLAWGNTRVNQAQTNTQQIAEGFEELALAVASTLEGLSASGLAEEEQRDVEESARALLRETTESEPNRGALRRGLATIKGFLFPIAHGVSDGTAAGAKEWAQEAIRRLSEAPIPS
ncbi:hypothetical protein ABZ249_16475 [Nocardiopsis sp. NPDC006139]|uniref:hypothetical protein n=1 Tax=Nocardiopsis sp. NPDC006139 TaxID=3154578 RepID=UPI0033B9430B